MGFQQQLPGPTSNCLGCGFEIDEKVSPDDPLYLKNIEYLGSSMQLTVEDLIQKAVLKEKKTNAKSSSNVLLLPEVQYEFRVTCEPTTRTTKEGVHLLLTKVIVFLEVYLDFSTPKTLMLFEIISPPSKTTTTTSSTSSSSGAQTQK